MYRFAYPVRGVAAVVVRMGEVEVEVTIYRNTLLWYNDRTYRHIDQCAAGSKPVTTKISEPLYRDLQKDLENT
jgi:hypothetical protein